MFSFSVEYSAALLCSVGIYKRYQTFLSLIGAGIGIPLLRGLPVARVRSAFFYEQKGGKAMPDLSKANRNYRVIQYLLWFMLGAARFSVSQPLLRIPLLGLLNHDMWFTMFSTLHPVLAMIIIGFSVSVSKEGFRFLFRQFLLRPAEHTVMRSSLLDLGHDRIETGLILTPLLMQRCISSVLHTALVEHVLAMLLHLILAVIVWNGFQTRCRFRYLTAMIALYGLVGSVPSLPARGGMQVIFVELIPVGTVLCIGTYIVLSRKPYL